MASPQFYPRAQWNGLLRWTCVYCARVNEHRLHHVVYKCKCSSCGRYTWWTPAAHIPTTGLKRPKDVVIPLWPGDDFIDDKLKFDPMPIVPFVKDRRLAQRGRGIYLVIHDNILLTGEDMPQSDGEGELVEDE